MNLKERILKNDNRMTAFPYLILLQEKIKYVTKEGYGGDTEIVYIEKISGDYNEAKTLDELINWWNEGLEENEKKYDLEEGKDYEKLILGYYWNTVNVFFTDKGVQEHLDKNKHNLHEYRTYGIHAFRNDEMDEIYELLGVGKRTK